MWKWKQVKVGGLKQGEIRVLQRGILGKSKDYQDKPSSPHKNIFLFTKIIIIKENAPGRGRTFDFLLTDALSTELKELQYALYYRHDEKLYILNTKNWKVISYKLAMKRWNQAKCKHWDNINIYSYH